MVHARRVQHPLSNCVPHLFPTVWGLKGGGGQDKVGPQAGHNSAPNTHILACTSSHVRQFSSSIGAVWLASGVVQLLGWGGAGPAYGLRLRSGQGHI